MGVSYTLLGEDVLAGIKLLENVNHVNGEDGPVGGKFVEDGHVEGAAAHPLEVVVPTLGELDALLNALLGLHDDFRLPEVEELAKLIEDGVLGEVLDEIVGGVVVVNPVDELVLGMEELQDLLPIVL